jgi:glycosyltransferase involved in cell wall biosynthesis
MRELQKIRIMYVNHTGLVSGAERVLVDMLRGLDRDFYEPFVLCPAEGELRNLIQAEGVEWQPAPVLNARFTWRPGLLLQYTISSFKAIAAMRKSIARLQPDILHANTLRAGITTTLATIGTSQKVLWHLHDILPRHPVSTVIRFLAFFSPQTHFIAVSHASARAFAGALPFSGRVRVIHNGIDLARFPEKTPDSSVFRQQAAVPADAFLVCAIGQICARKGLHKLLEAFSRIYTCAPRIHLAIVGKAVFPHEQKYEESLVSFAATAGIAHRVHFTGERRDIPAILQAADLLVLNSVEEPFGLVLIEAMSCGTPVLATRVGGIPEIVKDSVNGWLVEDGNIPVLAAKLLELSQQPDALFRAAQTAQEITCPKFSLERFLGDLHQLYAELNGSLTRERNRLAPATPVGYYGSGQGDEHA